MTEFGPGPEMMGKMNGVEVCKILRNNKNLNDTLITFLTARNEDFSEIAGLDAGADDYIFKPIKPKVFALFSGVDISASTVVAVATVPPLIPSINLAPKSK